jgi:chromosome segregation ATPase
MAMALELLKKQIEEMDTKISKITNTLEKKTILIKDLEVSYENIGEQLKNEKTEFISLQDNKNYLIDVKNETESNYKQINDAASTLLEILKSKTDKI